MSCGAAKPLCKGLSPAWKWCGEESIRSSIPRLIGRRPSGPRLPVADPPGSAVSTCAQPCSGQGKALVFFRRSVSLSRPRQEHGLPLIKNSRARALASSQRLSLERRLRRSLNHADVSSELTMRAFPAGSNAMAAEEIAPKISRDFYFSNSSIYIEKV